MILAFDIGNTNIVIGGFEKDKTIFLTRVATDLNKTEAEYAVLVKNILEIYRVERESIEGSIVSSVVPPLNNILIRVMELICGKSPLVVGPGIKTGLNLRVDEPGSVAADLIVGGVAASACYGAPAIVIDMGTATTLTVVDKNNCFRGGVIIPGVKLSYGALAAGTSLLPDVAILPPKKVVGSNTVDCMRSGAVYGTAAMIDGMTERMEAELGYPCTVIATGSLAKDIIPCCRRPGIIVDNELLLRGLWTLYQKNR